MPLVALKNYKAAEVAAMLHGHAEGSGYLCRCPVPTHGKGRGDRRPSLGVSDGRRGVVFHCFAGCSHDQVAAAIDNLAGSPLPAAAPVVGGVKPKTTSTFARKLWAASRPIAGTLADKYLRSIGFIAPPPATVRFLPRYHAGVQLRYIQNAGQQAVEAVHGRFGHLDRLRSVACP